MGKKRGPKVTDISGQTFGRLTPRRYLEKSVWLCECECGKEITATKWELETGRKRSCGCEEFLPDPKSPLKPIFRQNFFQVLAYNPAHDKALCLCICGKEFPLRTKDMLRAMSCGCIVPGMKDRDIPEELGLRRRGHPLYSTWTSMRANARRYRLEIDPDWDSDFLWFLCWCYSQEDYWEYYSIRHTKRMYLRRMNLKQGYTPANCKWKWSRSEGASKMEGGAWH